jgi:hypothetical protein
MEQRQHAAAGIAAMMGRIANLLMALNCVQQCGQEGAAQAVQCWAAGVAPELMMGEKRQLFLESMHGSPHDI